MSDGFDGLARALGRVCLAAAEAPDDLAALGASGRWGLYRDLVRGRVRGALAEALPRCREAAGASRFEAWVAAWLDACPPRTRYVRELMPEFVRWLDASGEAREGLPEYFEDLLRFEVALHFVGLAPDPSPEALAADDFAMDRPARFHPVLRRLDLRWDVLAGTPPEAAPSPRAVLVYRDATRFTSETLALSPIAAAVIDAMREGRDGVTACVQRTLASRELSAGAEFIESFAELLGTLLERRVILGSAR
ncbi:MAG: putative DNA-binding domain-containing protein [Polyangiales bacterium]